MYYPNIRRKRSGTPILSRKEIDKITENLIADFCPEALKNPQEIDVDLFVQDYMKMDQDFQYLSHCGVYLGMTVFNDTDKIPVYDPVKNRAEYVSERARTIIIDNTLLEESQEHRYRFTVGHEGGHGYFHTEYFAYDPNQLTFMDLLGRAFRRWFSAVLTQRSCQTVWNLRRGAIGNGWNGRQTHSRHRFSCRSLL